MLKLKFLLQGAAIAFAVSSSVAQAAPVTPTVDVGATAVSHSFGTLSSASESDTSLNLSTKDAFVDAFLTGTGSLTIATFADPFKPGALGVFDLLAGPPLVAGSVLVSWGGKQADLSDRLDKDGSTPYSMTISGASNVEDLVFSWSLGESKVALSGFLAAVPAPAGLILLLTALGGVAAVRRRGPGKRSAA